MSVLTIRDLASAELVAGDFLSRDEFLRRWEASPQIKFAELIRGIVYMPSPISADHGDYDGFAGLWLGTYALATPGCRHSHNASWLMEGQEVPQPDISLRILPEYGGQSRYERNLLAGSPEHLTEICLSSTSNDLHQKLEIYEESGVQEYLAVLVREREIRWHRLRDGKLKAVPQPSDGIYRSEVFPGLWLDAPALLAGEMSRVQATLQRGIASAEHAKFQGELAARRQT